MILSLLVDEELNREKEKEEVEEEKEVEEKEKEEKEEEEKEVWKKYRGIKGRDRVVQNKKR